MGTQFTRGFTIIETMLFLAISGLLIVAMVAGTGATINIQRYRDAVETFKTVLQNQYGELTSVQNERSNTWNCGPQAETVEGGDEIRGQSDCVLVGRYMAIVGDAITIHTVLARPNLVPVSASNDIADILSNYTLNISTVEKQEELMEWGTQIAWPVSGDEVRTPSTPRSLAILFMRSPASGQIYTFTGDTAVDEPTPQTLSELLVADAVVPGQAGRTICVDSNGLFVTSEGSIYINPYATGPTSIEVRSNSFIESIGEDTRC